MIDLDTKSWIRNEGDERAAANGCRFDVLRASWTIWWIERYCKLYEGEGYAGNPLILHGCKQCDHSHLWALPEHDPEALTERARLYSECVNAGHALDWQYECFMRIFGWVKHNQKWKREVRRFKKASIWIPKKHGKSPSLAALSWYLTAGDGEPGQKTFLAAKDGQQVRLNACKHAVEMWLQSPELRQECTLNRSNMQFTHEPSRSIMRPLSSSNSRTQQSNEGHNGNILVDETHVVDRAFIDRISRAGISRSEFLFAEFSTAGDNPDGYGKESFDYSADVLSGKRTDEEHFAAIYAAPQDISDDELDADFDTIAANANPSIGRLIDPQEIRSDYERSKITIEKLATFKKYRLNVWQHSSNPWLRPSDWAKCGASYTEADLLGRTCFGGLDLGLKWDTTAFVLLFPWEEKIRLWVYFFIPESSARSSGDKIPWREWAKRGDIQITSGNATDFPLVRQTVRDASRKFDLQTVAYDDRFAEYLTQELQDTDGIAVSDFNQTPGNFLEPMGLIENDVLSQRLEHPNNLCMNWQAGNATKGRNGLLEKPPDDVTKKIDGFTALIQARAMLAVGDCKYSFYDSHKVEMF